MKEVKFNEMLKPEFIPNNVILIRVQNFLIWYEKHAERNKCLFWIISISVITLTASIPVLNLFKDTWKDVTILVSIFSAVASVLTSILTLVNIKDNWKRYRKTAELLKREINLYANKCGEYCDFELLNIIGAEERKNETDAEKTKRLEPDTNDKKEKIKGLRDSIFVKNIERIGAEENSGWEKNFESWKKI